MFDEKKFDDWCGEYGSFRVEGNDIALIPAEDMPQRVPIQDLTDNAITRLFRKSVDKFAECFDRYENYHQQNKKPKLTMCLLAPAYIGYEELPKLTMVLMNNGYQPSLSALKKFVQMVDVHDQMMERDIKTYNRLASDDVKEMFRSLEIVTYSDEYEEIYDIAKTAKEKAYDRSLVTNNDICHVIDQLLATEKVQDANEKASS